DAARAEARRQLPGQVVLALYRLVKACLLHNDSNQTVVSLVPPAVSAVLEFCSDREAGSARIVFADQIVFVNRRTVRGSRELLAIGHELGGFLNRAGVNEVTIERDVTREALGGFARFVADAQRHTASPEALEKRFSGIAGRKIDLDDADVVPE